MATAPISLSGSVGSSSALSQLFLSSEVAMLSNSSSMRTALSPLRTVSTFPAQTSIHTPSFEEMLENIVLRSHSVLSSLSSAVQSGASALNLTSLLSASFSLSSRNVPADLSSAPLAELFSPQYALSQHRIVQYATDLITSVLGTDLSSPAHATGPAPLIDLFSRSDNFAPTLTPTQFYPVAPQQNTLAHTAERGSFPARYMNQTSPKMIPYEKNIAQKTSRAQLSHPLRFRIAQGLRKFAGMLNRLAGQVDRSFSL